MNRLPLPQELRELAPWLKAAPAGATIEVHTSEERTAVQALSRRLRRQDLQVDLVLPVAPHPWFFVTNLGDGRGKVSLLDDDGRTRLGPDGAPLSVEFPGPAPLELGGEKIPGAVLEAALRQAPEQGDYVTSEGRSIDPRTLELRAA